MEKLIIALLVLAAGIFLWILVLSKRRIVEVGQVLLVQPHEGGPLIVISEPGTHKIGRRDRGYVVADLTKSIVVSARSYLTHDIVFSGSCSISFSEASVAEIYKNLSAIDIAHYVWRLKERVDEEIGAILFGAVRVGVERTLFIDEPDSLKSACVEIAKALSQNMRTDIAAVFPPYGQQAHVRSDVSYKVEPVLSESI